MVMMRYPMLSNSLLIFYALNHEYLGIVFYLMTSLSFIVVALPHREAIIYCMQQRDSAKTSYTRYELI